jgi:hypothetical protein
VEAMPTVEFAQSIRSHVPVERCEVSGATVREALEAVFTRHERLRGYVLDDRGAVRKHVAIVVNGEAIADREGLSDRLEPEGEIFVMQALSGG